MSLMVAFLLAPTDSIAIHGLSDLVKQKKIKWTYQAGTAHESLFDPSGLTSGVYREIGRRAAPLVPTPEEGFKKVHIENMAFIKDKSRIEFQAATECQTLGTKLIISD